MSELVADRPQDVGRKHERKRRPIGRNTALLARYQDTMREELISLLNILREPGTPLTQRERTWKLAILLAKELGADLEPPTKLHRPAAVDNGPATAVNF